MRVVVGGATGFIGSALVRALLERGDQVVVLAINPSRAHREFGGTVEVWQWQPPTIGPWADAVDGADAIVNMAGYPVAEPTKPWTADRRALILKSRIDSTRALVETVQSVKRKPSVFVNQSAIGYYGSRGDRLLTEASPAGDDFLADVVSQWEAAARPVEKFGVRLVILRTGIVLGRGGGLVKQLELPFKLFAGGTMGYPGQWVSWIHLEDEVGVVLCALDNPDMRGIVNAVAPAPVTMQTFSSALGAALGRPSWVPFLWAPMKLLLGRRAEAVLASQRVEPTELVRIGYEFEYRDVEAALRASV